MDLANYSLEALHHLHNNISDIANATEVEMHQVADIHSDLFKELEEKLLYHSTLLKIIFLEIKKRQSTTLLFSVEDMFRLVGQFDKYVIIYFYKSSNAYQHYGEEVHGHIIYDKSYRHSLTQIIAQENHSRTDGKILFDITNIDNKKISLLKTQGFLASEIYKIQTFNHEPDEVSYQKRGTKKIPNSIIVEFESNGTDSARVENLIMSWKISDGYKILDHDWLRYYVNKLILGEKVEEEYLNNHVKENGVFKEQALVQLNTHAMRHNILGATKKDHFNTILNMRLDRRIKLLKKDLGITKAVFEKFQRDHPEAYRNTSLTLLSFNQETLTSAWPDYPIYWDEERFIHIYGRHYVDYFINFSNYKGTHFQYTYNDIRRMICLILDKLKSEIRLSLSKGKGFNKYGDQGYYFNGDYYTIRIDENGKLMTFFPMAKPDFSR